MKIKHNKIYEMQLKQLFTGKFIALEKIYSFRKKRTF